MKKKYSVNCDEVAKVISRGVRRGDSAPFVMRLSHTCTSLKLPLLKLRMLKGYSNQFVCLSVCLSVCHNYSGASGAYHVSTSVSTMSR